jgi:hypothetical protein
MSGTLDTASKRVEVMDGRIADANQKIDAMNKKLDVVVEAAWKIPGVGQKKD